MGPRHVPKWTHDCFSCKLIGLYNVSFPFFVPGSCFVHQLNFLCTQQLLKISEISLPYKLFFFAFLVRLQHFFLSIALTFILIRGYRERWSLVVVSSLFTMVRRQVIIVVVVGVAINSGGKVCNFDLFFSCKTYLLIIRKLYKIYNPYIIYGLTIGKYHTDWQSIRFLGIVNLYNSYKLSIHMDYTYC